MDKKHRCKKFYATEEYFLKGELLNNVLYLKTTGDSNGIEDIRCFECNKEITHNFRIELC